jgi:hypothetical protein
VRFGGGCSTLAHSEMSSHSRRLCGDILPRLPAFIGDYRQDLGQFTPEALMSAARRQRIELPGDEHQELEHGGVDILRIEEQPLALVGLELGNARLLKSELGNLFADGTIGPFSLDIFTPPFLSRLNVINRHPSLLQHVHHLPGNTERLGELGLGHSRNNLLLPFSRFAFAVSGLRFDSAQYARMPSIVVRSKYRFDKM